MKRKRPQPRDPSAETPPDPRRRGAVRLASEPISRRQKLTDRWEPGFLRLAGRPRGRALSYVVDGIGIYYDATTPSELEILLEEGGWETDHLLARARDGMAALRAGRLSIDNDPRRIDLADAPEAAPWSGTGRTRIVVVDQPRGDPAVGFGLAGAGRFAAMLAAAEAENPDCEIAVIMDPAVSAGADDGHILSGRPRPFVRFVRDKVAAWSAVETCDRLYTVTAHLGFEAACAGRPVACFGAPFYAGWGFTDDRLEVPRRTRRRKVEEVFAAAFLVYSRYYDPYRGERTTFEDALAILDLCVRHVRDNSVPTLCLGFASWKRRWVNTALGGAGLRPVVTNRTSIAPEDLQGTARVVAWASRAPDGIEEACEAAGTALLRMEDGFVRSVGLGVGLRPGSSYVLDRTGIYYDATRPSDLETLLREGTFDEALLARAAALRSGIVAGGLSKYNVGDHAVPALPTGRTVVLVAGQVENDASIRLGMSHVAGNAGLLRRVRERDPDALIVYKPHPDVEAGLRPGYVAPAELAGLADVVLREVSAHAAIEAADRVEVATSLLGFEALLRGKPVTTHGLPFYAGWGLTADPGSPRRGRRLTLDQLVAAALIVYPRYLDPVTDLPCTPEVLVARLRDASPALGRRELTFEALLKAAWSQAVRRTRR